MKKSNAVLSPEHVERFLDELFCDDLHANRVRSLADATLGVLHAGALGVHAIGRGLAAARGLNDKHAVRQVDRKSSPDHPRIFAGAPLESAPSVRAA